MKDTHFDVSIAGSGITALTAALLLSERGRRVAVIARESDDLGAEITVVIDAGYHFLRRHFGREVAKVVADASRAAVEKIAELVQRDSIDCDFRRVPAYLYTEKRRYVAELKNEAAAAREAGLDAQFVTEVPLPFATRGAVLFPDQAQFDAEKYVDALKARAVAAGAQFFGAGDRVTADAVFDTTYVPAGAISHRTQHIAFADEGPHPDGLFRDTADPYHSTRRDRGFLVVSGVDVDDYAREYYPSRTEHHRWPATIVEPPDGLPIIGRANDIYVSTGYGGQIATFATLGAMIVADLIAGTPSPWADAFAPHRAGAGEDAPRHFG